LCDDLLVTVMIALLRGINVGGHNKLAMADLRAIAEDCGLRDVSTYIQSGNVVFRTDRAEPGAVADRLSAAIHSSAGLAVPVTVRIRDEFRVLVGTNPFPAAGDAAHPVESRYVLFRLSPVPVAAADLTDFDAFAPDRIAVAGRDVHMYLPDGMGSSKLATIIARRKPFEGTVRGWLTIGALLDMADAITS
jgi:uncharacterized protein (DUF1697 family)